MLEFKAVISEEQIKEVQEIAKQIWPDAFKDILSKEQIAYMLDLMYSIDSLRKQIGAGAKFYLCEFNKELIGYFSIEFNYKPTATQVHKVYLSPNYQGKGYGKKIFSFITELAKQNKQKNLQLNVNRYNKKAISFYLAYGFKILKEGDFAIGNAFLMEDYIMEKSLV